MTTETELLALTTNISTLVNTVNTQQGNINTVLADLQTAINTVDNLVSDNNKPISVLQQQALDTKQGTLDIATNFKTINDIDLTSGPGNISIERGAVELPTLAYANRISLRLPTQSSQPEPGDTVVITGLGMFQFRSTTELMHDLNMAIEVIQPSDGVTVIGQWFLETPAYEWLEAQSMYENAVLNDWMEDEQTRSSSY